MKKETKHVTVKIPRDLVNQMDKLKGKYGFRSRGEIAKEAIRKLLGEYEERVKPEHLEDLKVSEDYIHKFTHSKFKSCLKESSDPAWITDRAGRIVEANKKFEEFAGSQRKDFVGKHFLELLNCNPERFPELMIAFSDILGGEEITLPIFVKTPDGKRKVLAEAKPIKLADHVIGIMVTLKELKDD